MYYKLPVSLLSILCLTACHNLDATTHDPSNMDTINRQKAFDDLKSKKLKYYFQSIHYPNKHQIQYCRDSLYITLLSAADFQSRNYTSNNQTVDSIVFMAKGIHIGEILHTLK
ncbi:MULTISPECIES: hypothetical protein [Chitinophagaceae]